MSGSRRKNVAEMSVTEQIEDIAERMCTDYCRYPGLYHERLLRDEYKNPDEADEAMQKEICEYCPLMRL